ncbi:MAG TPA: hypothetical protein VFC07_03610 [Verrucomicrobiae bacterium]|nr:hypothetical protein [Verrucomicrobiae bacterium]
METKPQQVSVSLRHPGAYIASYMVNRFHLARNSGFTLAQFGLVDDSGKLLEMVGCILTDATLLDLRENLVGYSAKVGLPKKKAPVWNPPIEEYSGGLSAAFCRYGVVDFVHLTNWQDAYAEICFWNYSKAGLADHFSSDTKEPYPTWGLALLRCDIDLQREFLEALYPAV